MFKHLSEQLNLACFAQTLEQEHILNAQESNKIVGGKNLDLVLVWTKPKDDDQGS